MTPWQTKACCESFIEQQKIEHDNRVWIMWHGAVLRRIKKIPPLDEFLSAGKKKVKGIDERAILERLKAYQKRVENGDRN